MKKQKDIKLDIPLLLLLQKDELNPLLNLSPLSTFQRKSVKGFTAFHPGFPAIFQGFGSRDFIVSACGSPYFRDDSCRLGIELREDHFYGRPYPRGRQGLSPQIIERKLQFFEGEPIDF
jgi:hypothetical protein